MVQSFTKLTKYMSSFYSNNAGSTETECLDHNTFRGSHKQEVLDTTKSWHTTVAMVKTIRNEVLTASIRLPNVCNVRSTRYLGMLLCTEYCR